ncbi:hypothetical protein F2Q69_00050784 [Brassica cretica]|uniref:Uncharacterized protein n=1 Tax=Brassica cretica TaxID=69181 RepID=A0A8S9PVG6_BRACR|nr:hypothetical protein F2Q69_00050784 [Brassica cretica]
MDINRYGVLFLPPIGSKPRTDRNNHRSSIFVLVFSVTEEGSKLTTDRNPPPRTTTLSLLTVSPPSFLVFSDSRRIETHHRSKFYELVALLVGRAGHFHEVEPYIPFNINPAGMQPVLTTTYLLAFPSILASVLDHYLRSINQGFSIGFTSVLIIVGSIIELRRSYHAYNVMPSLSKTLKRYGVWSGFKKHER